MKLRCFLDGNALCIVKPGFVNLAEDEAMFITLRPAQLKEYKELEAQAVEAEYPHDDRCEGCMCWCNQRAKREDPEKYAKWEKK